MAQSIKSTNIYEQSRLTQGVADITHSRAEVGFCVDGIDGIDLDGVNDFVAGELGPYHEFDTTLPLLTVTSQILCPDKTATGTAVYGYSRATDPPAPTFDIVERRYYGDEYVSQYYRRDPAHSQSTQSDGTISVPEIVWDTDGSIPVEDFLGSQTYRASVWQVTARTVLDSDPFGTIKTLIDKVNTEAITINGATVAAATIQFKSADINPIVTANGIRYEVVYVFKQRDVAFLNTNLHLDTFGPTGTLNATLKVSTYNGITFTGAFPTHGGNKP